LIDRANRSVVASSRGDSAGGRVKKIAWQYDGDIAKRTTRLAYSLFESFGPAPSRRTYDPTSISAAAFSELVKTALSSYLAIQHDLHSSRWDSMTASFLANYVKFWNELPPCSDRAPILVFISIIFPRVNRSSWEKLFSLRSVTGHMRQKRIWSTLIALAQASSIPCRVLPELPPITREDVLEWFSLNNIHDSEEKRMLAVDRLFQGSTVRPKAMWEIETFCAEELRTFAAERGYDERWQWNQALFGRGHTGVEAQSAAASV
jgi:hypothetical protein